MTDPMQTEREAFEEWAEDRSLDVADVNRNDGRYDSHVTQRYYQCWQAALSSQASELRSLRDALALAKAALMEKAERIDDLKLAMQRLCRVFPTDGDMAEAGWVRSAIEEACNAYDHARAALKEDSE